MNELLLRRRVASIQSLPYDSEVEYLQSSGTQYIDTGVDYDSTVVVETRLMFLESVAASPFGIYYNDGTARRWQVHRSSSNRVYTYYNTVTNKYLSGIASNAWHYIHADSRYLGIGGSSLDSAASAFNPSHSVSIYVFARHNVQPSSSLDYMDSSINMRLSGMTIMKGGVLVRDYIPVRKGSVGYLYDRVSGILFGNIGTGNFTLGNDIPATYDAQVEYIQGSGAQWILTDFKASNKSKVVIDFEVDYSGDNSPWIFGARNGAVTATDKMCMYFNSVTPVSYYMMGSSNGQVNSVPSAGRHTIEMSLADDVWLDGTKIYTYSASEKASVFTNTYPMALFNMWNGLVRNNTMAGKLYSFYVMEDNVKVFDLIPVRAGQEGCLYDKVSKKLYRSIGYDSFTFGNDI